MKTYEVSVIIKNEDGSPGKNWKEYGLYPVSAINRAQAEYLAQKNVERDLRKESFRLCWAVTEPWPVQYQVKEIAAR